MEIDQTRTFKVDKKKKKNCQLPTDEIKIKKRLRARNQYSFIMVEPSPNSGAYVVCMSGFVSQLLVPANAKECGIGNFLMQLCFNEGTIHNVENNNENRALTKLRYEWESKSIPMAEEMEKWVRSKCDKILHLKMAADPASAAHLYFNSAKDSGYTEMFIALQKEFYPTEGPCSVMTLKERYTADGYMIDDDGTEVRILGNNKVKVHGRYWFFCKPKTPTLHVKCTKFH